MPSVADLVERADLQRAVDRETYTRGLELATRVRMSAFGPLPVAATVEGDEPAAVDLRVEADGLAWTCSAGDASPALVCPHVGAVAVESWRRSPTPRSPTGRSWRRQPALPDRSRAAPVDQFAGTPRGAAPTAAGISA